MTAPPPEPAEPIKANKTQTKSVESIKATICSQILERLGRPYHLFKIDTGNVGGDNYRVNVWCETPPKETVKNADGMITQEACLVGGYVISDSFYIKASPEGGIVSSSPPIKKKY